ncbi:MAG: hypothetical protein RMM06_10850 [Armatimonadota bacterium]|nr:hypothetical protein [Armatimonadota bacterium]
MTIMADATERIPPNGEPMDATEGGSRRTGEEPRLAKHWWFTRVLIFEECNRLKHLLQRTVVRLL